MLNTGARVALCAAMFTAALLNSSLISSQTDQWLHDLSKAEQAVDAEEWDDAIKQISESYASWSARQPYLHIVTNHNILDQTEELFHQLLALCDEMDAAEARLHLAALRTQISLLAETEKLAITNIL